MVFAELKSDQGVDTTPIKDWEHISIGKYDNTRLYYKPKENGLAFYVLDFNSCSYSNDIVWKVPDAEVDVVVKGHGYFDGLRHIYFGEEDGYIYYPNIQRFVEIFTKLRELEKKCCWDADEDGNY